MKKITQLTILFLCFLISVNAQNVPLGMQYQAVARDHFGQVISNQKITLKITLYSQEDKQTQYSETHSSTTNSLGLFSLTIGEGTPQKGTFEAVPWSTENIWMELAIDEAGGKDFITISDSKLLAVPYAFHAATAGQLSGKPGATGEKAFEDNWKIGGNTFPPIATPGSQIPIFGTSTYQDLILITNNTPAMVIAAADGKVDIMGDTKVGSDLEVINDAVVGNDVQIGNNVQVGNDARIGNDLDVKEDARLGTLNVKNTTDLNGSLDVNYSSPTNLTGTLNVDGVTDLNSALNVNNNSPTDLTGTLNVDGATDLNSTLNVNNNSPSYLTGRLTVDGLTDLNNTTQSNNITDGALHVKGGVGIERNLNIGGDAKFNKTLSVVTAANSGNEFGGHVAHFENTLSGQGIRVKVGANTPHNDNNFITFLNSSGSIVGRIEGEHGSDDFDNNLEYKNDLLFMDLDIALASTDLAISLAELVQAGVALAAASSSTTGCAGVGACVTSPIPSLIGSAGADLVLQTANSISAGLSLANVIAAKVTFENTHEALQGITFASGAEDYAEYLPKMNPADDFLPGEVVGMKNGFISKNTLGADRIMVISFKPAVLGGLPQNGEEDKYEKVAFLGQIPTRVIGAVEPGDYILPSGFNNGHAIAKHPEEMLLSDYKKILGMAWERSGDQPVNLINVAIGLNVNDLSGVVQQQQEELTALKSEMAQTNAALAKLIPGFSEAAHLDLHDEEVLLTQTHDAPTESTTHTESDGHHHDFLTQHDVEMTRPDETNIVYYVPEKTECIEWIDAARKIYIESGGEIETHPFWNRLETDPDYLEEVVVGLKSKFDHALHYHVDANKSK